MNMWNERYGESNYYGSQPNDFLREEVVRLKPGNVLCLAESQGRNAIFLAQQGFETTAMDQSDVGMRRAANLELQGLEIVIGRERQRPVEEGRYHQGLGAVVQFVARKPAALGEDHLDKPEHVRPESAKL